MTLLELQGLKVRYGRIEAIHDMSITVEKGEVVSLIGANGAGKTTTLRAVSGTVRKRGEVVFDGRMIARESPQGVARRGIAHVPEGRGLFLEHELPFEAYLRVL